ncbi:MAG: methyltransferase [Deltaproteobacteria bacterium]|nr:methyltransferase [Deltaproteobacteria bacterium]
MVVAPAPGVHRGSKARLTQHHLDRFVDDTLVSKLARAVCRAECLPRKELFEAWELAKRVRRHVRGGRVIDLAAGHGLLAYAMLILDGSSPEAFAVDEKTPDSAAKLARSLEAEWPRLEGRVQRVNASIRESLPFEIAPSDVVVSMHACGELTDRVLEVALSAGAAVAVVPCCHSLGKSDTGGLLEWVDGPLAVDLVRAERVRAAGYSVRTFRIPEEITPMNRGLLAVKAS